MTATITKPQAITRPPGRLFDPGGARSLDDLVSFAWEGLGSIEERPLCMVCSSPLAWNGDARVADCDSCGSRLE